MVRKNAQNGSAPYLVERFSAEKGPCHKLQKVDKLETADWRR